MSIAVQIRSGVNWCFFSTQQVLQNLYFNLNLIYCDNGTLYQKVHNIRKDRWAIIFHMTPCDLRNHSWGLAMTFTVQGHFRQILQQKSFMSAQNLPKVSLHRNCHSIAYRMATQVTKESYETSREVQKAAQRTSHWLSRCQQVPTKRPF